ncbi:MAG: histidine kinase [Bacteroides sp.]|nr:histidine kinase [Bacteroides sp.]
MWNPSGNHKRLMPLIHLFGWCIVFVFPLFLLDKENNDPTIDWMRYFNFSIIPLSLALVFYINYFVLVPTYLFQEKIKKFILVNILLVATVGLGIQGWQIVYRRMETMTQNPERGIYTQVQESEMSELTQGASQQQWQRKPPPIWMFFTWDIFFLILMVSFSVAIRMSIRWSQAENARREAERSCTEAELRNLRNQLNPHFLLNTLNNIYALIAFNSEKAQQAVHDLSKLLRYVLYDNQHTVVPLIKEIDFIKNYIELMRIRLASHVRLTTKFRIREESSLCITPLIFISLIENAFKHGVSPVEPSYIHIMIYENQQDQVICEIRNSNFPKTESDKSGSGIGLEQVKKRLELLYPNNYLWHTDITPDGKEYNSILVISTQHKNIQP